MTEPSAEQVLAEIQRIAEAELDWAAPIELRHELVRDLQLDSMGAMILAVGLENKFRVKLEEQDAGRLLRVEDLVRLVQMRCRMSHVAGT